MRINVPKEIKNHEYRVAMTPSGVHELHLAADASLTEALPTRKVTALAYETVQCPPARLRCSTRCPRSPDASRRASGRRLLAD